MIRQASTLLCAVLLAGSVFAQDLHIEEEKAIKAAVAEAADSVVRIETVGGLEKVGRSIIGTGPTTGLIVSSDGLIVSSAFNFVQQPTSILVTIPGGESRLAAKIVARDKSRALVLLKIEADKPLEVPEAAPRDELIVGQWSIALGRTFAADQVSMSAGVVSATHRIWSKAVQTDAKISPANYGGPLIDIRGRVIGVLVPMSPRGSGDMAGSEWYDSGIGFAVPLDEVFKRLDQWGEGEDLQPGILGIALKGNDVYSKPAEVASVRLKSPAAEAGLEAGDVIVEINGQEVTRQAQLKHALGPLYAGDKVKVTVDRDGKDVELPEVALVAELIPYKAPYLGVQPARETDAFVVRHVMPGSPAEDAGILPGDVIQKWNGRETPAQQDVRDAAGGSEAGDEVTLSIDRGGQQVEVKLVAEGLPSDPPEELPPAPLPDGPAPADGPESGVVEVKIPEAKNDCFALVPDAYRHDAPHGLLVWLHAPNKFDQQAMIDQWKDHCEARGIILLAPQSADPKRWTAPETEFVEKAVEDIRNRYNIDGRRVVVGGNSAGGAMAWLFGFQQRDIVRGIVAVDAPVPRGSAAPESDPQKPLALYVTAGGQPRQNAAIEQHVERLRKAELPVTFKDKPDYGDEQRAETARWLDSLDRL